jgi:hypothetical protein
MSHSSLAAFEAWLDIAVAELQIRLLPFRAVRKASQMPDMAATKSIPRDAVETFLKVSSAHVARPRCLTRSLALFRFLRRRGVAAELRMGLGTDGGGSGHAWVAVGDEIIRDSELVEETFGRMNISEPVRVAPSTGRFAISPDVAWQMIADEAVLVNLTSGMSLGLNETGSLVWTRLAGATLDEVAAAMAEQFDTSMDEARRDVADLVGELQRRGFVAV